MHKGIHFFGLPLYGQLIKSLNREKIVEISKKHGGERYVKSFDGYTHLLTSLLVSNSKIGGKNEKKGRKYLHSAWFLSKFC